MLGGVPCQQQAQLRHADSDMVWRMPWRWQQLNREVTTCNVQAVAECKRWRDQSDVCEARLLGTLAGQCIALLRPSESRGSYLVAEYGRWHVAPWHGK